VEAVESKAQMHARSRGPNPIFLRTSRRNDQSTVSKALVMSSFRRIAAYLELCSLRAVPWTIMKIS
jgi:hypothetical protein